MRNIKMLLTLTALGLMTGPIVAWAQTSYDYQTIDYPGAEHTQVFGINNRGEAAGTGYTETDSFPFVYDVKEGTLTNVTPVAGYDSTFVAAISSSGNVVGSVEDNGSGRESGLILDKKGNATVFDHPDAVSLTQARGVNNRGLVTGYRDSVSGDQLGFLYDSKTNSFTDIVPSLFTIAHGINSRGDVVGSALFFDPLDSPCPGSPGVFLFGWLRTAEGHVTFFDVNGGSTRARGITDSGTIAGFAVDPITTLTKGFVVQLDGSPCQSISVAPDDLIEFPGAVYTAAEGIKNSGEVVGIYHDVSNATRGFIATPK